MPCQAQNYPVWWALWPNLISCWICLGKHSTRVTFSEGFSDLKPHSWMGKSPFSSVRRALIERCWDFKINGKARLAKAEQNRTFLRQCVALAVPRWYRLSPKQTKFLSSLESRDQDGDRCCCGLGRLPSWVGTCPPVRKVAGCSRPTQGAASAPLCFCLFQRLSGSLAHPLWT